MNLLDALTIDVGLYLVNVAIAVTLACALGVAATRLLRSRPAPVRYGLLLAALLMALGAPGAVWIGSAVDICPLRVPIAAAEEQAGPMVWGAEPQPVVLVVESPAPAAPETPVEPMPAEVAPLGPPKAPAATPIPWSRLLVAAAVVVWTAGTVIGLAVMGRGLVLVWRLRGTLKPTDDGRPAQAAAWAAGVLGVSRPVEVRLSPSVPAPLSIGLVRPVIVLPEAMVSALEETDLQAVVLHEAAHIAHRDHWVGLLQRLALAMFWWNPLVRMLSGRLSEAREEVCDNYVVRAQGDGVRFARFLVDVAARTPACRRLTAAIGLVQHPRRGLEARVRKLLRKERDTMTRMNLTAVALAGVFAAGIAGLMVGCNIGAAKAELPGEAVAETDSPGVPAAAAEDPTDAVAVRVALLAKSPIRSIREYRHFLRITVPPAAPPLYRPARLPACDFEIRSERHPTRVARIPYVGYFRQNGEPGESARRRIGNLPDGDYLVALCVGQTRLSNVARLRIDSALDATKQPALELVPLPLASDGGLRYVGLVATGREKVDPEFTNMAAAFPALVVDGVERPLVKAMAWTGPVGPLQPGRRDVRFIDLSNYGLEITPEKTHRVRARVGRYTSAEVTVPATGALGKEWDEKTARLPFLRQPRVTLCGKVIGSAGQPAAGYEVGLSAPGGGHFRERCDEKGQYQFVNVPAGEYRLNANLPAKGQPIVSIEVVRIRADRTLVRDLSLEAKFGFSGKVVYEDGAPAAGAQVMATWASPDGTAEFGNFATVGPDGRYTVRSPYPEASYVGISMTGPHPDPKRGVKDGRTDVDFVMPRFWGNAVEGVACRLRPQKRVWRAGQTPIFSVDLRNKGTRHLKTDTDPMRWEIELDGAWYHCTTKARMTIAPIPLEPGGQHDNHGRRFTGATWRSKDGDKPLEFTPGRHTVRVAFTACATKRNAGPPVRAVSNPVEIEIVAAEITDAPQPETEGKKDSAKRTAAPSKTTVRGKVVDDATGKPVAGFVTQAGKFDPADPAKVVWGYSETRSGRKDGTFSATVRWSEGWTRRIVAAGYLPQPVLTQPPAPGQDRMNVVIRLKRGGTIRGRVLDHTSQPVAKAGVYLAGRGVIGLAEGPWGEFQKAAVHTDAEGRFEISGRGKDSKAIFVTGLSLLVWRADLPEPGHEAIIRLPEPANLHIRYDIEGGPPAAQVRIELRTCDMPTWKALVDMVRWVPVKAGEDGLVVDDLPPGVYHISRVKQVRAGNRGKGMMLDRQLKLTLASGKTTAYNVVRKTGTPITGEVVGLPKEGVNGVFVSVRDQRVSGDPRQLDEWRPRTFDGLALEGNGPFKTERLLPGKYEVVVEAYKAYKRKTREEMSRLDRRRPKWFGTARVNVPESGEPPKVRVMMRPDDARPAKKVFLPDADTPGAEVVLGAVAAPEIKIPRPEDGDEAPADDSDDEMNSAEKESAEETQRPTRPIPQITPTGGLSDEDLSWIYGRHGPETPERRKSLDNLRKRLLASKKTGKTRWGSEKWMKTPEYYAKLDTATLAEECFARGIFYNELSIYNDPRTGFVYLLVFHDGFAELYGRDDFWKGILHAYDSLSQKLVDPESSLREIGRVSGHLDEMRFFYGEPKFRRQLKGREKLFLEAHIRVLRRYAWYMDHHDFKKRASFGFWREPWCVAKVALMLTKQVDPERYARIAPKIDAVRFSKGQKPEELKRFVRLVLSSLEAEPKPEGSVNGESTISRDTPATPADDVVSTKKDSVEKESTARDKLNNGKTKSSVPIARPVDADAREQFLEIERIARLSAEEQAKQLPHLYRDLAPRYMNPFVEGIISSRRRNILDRKSIGSPEGDAYETWTNQLAHAAGEKSPEAVADAVGSGMWLNVAAKGRALWVFARHPKALDKLLQTDLDSAEKPSVKRAACTIGALKRTSFSGKLLQMYLADDEMSKEVWPAFLFMMDHSDIFEPLLQKVEKDPRLLIRCAGLFQRPLYRKPANPMLLKLVSSEDKEISYHAARALYECKDPKLAPLAAKFAKDPASRFRLTATYWAANLPGDAFNSIRKELLPLLADADEKVRFDALRCFAQQKDLAAGPVLLELLGREKPAEKPRAYEVTVMQALAALTGQQFGYFMHEWGPNRPSNRKAIEKLEAWLQEKAKNATWAEPTTGAGVSTEAKLSARKLFSARCGQDAGVLAVAFSPDGRTLAAVDEQGKVMLRDAGSGGQKWARDVLTPEEKRLLLYEDRQGRIHTAAIAFSPDGYTLAVAADPVVRLYDAQSGRLQRVLEDKQLVEALKELNRPPATVSRELEWLKAVPHAHGRVYSVAFSPDGTLLATSGSHLICADGSSVIDAEVATHGKLKLWDAKTGKLKRDLGEHYSAVRSVAFSRDGKTLASIGSHPPSWTSGVRLWDPQTGAVKSVVPTARGMLELVAFSPDGKLMATSTFVREADPGNPGSLPGRPCCRLMVWNARTGDRLFEHRIPALVTSLSFSADGKTLATAVHRRGVILWDPETLKSKGEIQPSTGPPRDVQVAFSPTGNLLAVGVKDAKYGYGFVTVWQIGQP